MINVFATLVGMELHVKIKIVQIIVAKKEFVSMASVIASLNLQEKIAH